MDVTEQARRSDALYYDSVSRRELCDMIAHLESTLHTMDDDAREHLKDFTAEARNMLAENAKLRELVADVHEALCSDKAGMFHKLILASMEDDMRELGVEVDE